MTTVAVKERPILFSGPMVRAILEGRKTMTRRPVKHASLWEDMAVGYHAAGAEGPGWYFWESEYPEEGSTRFDCPYGTVGDFLWVRETWAWSGDKTIPEMDRQSAGEIWFKAEPLADQEWPPNIRWRPSIHMPRWASRILLEITSVRVERVKSISEADAKKESCELELVDGRTIRDLPYAECWDYQLSFQEVWNATYPNSWDRNDWVWVISFKRLETRGRQ